MRRATKIDNVTITTIDDSDETYQDTAENTLKDIYAAHNSPDQAEQKRKEILTNQPTWPLYYHLTPMRGNLLRWYNFSEGATALEIGAGCGAITEELVRHPIDITSIELTKQRSLINAYRNREAKLNIVVGNLQQYKTDKKFDYIICVGVLEYAGSFIDSRSPYEEFLAMIRNRMTNSGKLILAIENRFGIKYWAGAHEDHTGRLFDGMNDYVGKKRVRTFGRQELTNLLAKAGFNKVNFYYPFPDYKTPLLIYSDDYYPGKGTSFPLNLLPTPTLDRPRHHFFSEQAAMRSIEANGLFPDFSNSFFVEAS